MHLDFLVAHLRAMHIFKVTSRLLLRLDPTRHTLSAAMLSLHTVLTTNTEATALRHCNDALLLCLSAEGRWYGTRNSLLELKDLNFISSPVVPYISASPF